MGPRPLSTSSAEGKAHREHREKLELAASFSFFGNVMSMASVQLAGAKRDALLLSFKDAKVGWAGFITLLKHFCVCLKFSITHTHTYFNEGRGIYSQMKQICGYQVL